MERELNDNGDDEDDDAAAAASCVSSWSKHFNHFATEFQFPCIFSASQLILKLIKNLVEINQEFS